MVYSSYKYKIKSLLILAGCQVPTQLLSYSPFSTRTRGADKMERLMGRDKDRKIAHQLPAQAKQTSLGEINLILLQINCNRVG